MSKVDKASRIAKLEELLKLSVSLSPDRIESKLLESVAEGILNGGEGNVTLVYEIAIMLLNRIAELKR